MPRPQHASFDKRKVVAENRRARFDYAIEEVFEAGIALTGTEVKSLRFGEGSIAESYAEVKDGEVWRGLADQLQRPRVQPRQPLQPRAQAAAQAAAQPA
jgi:hypothetical protein